MSNFVGHERIRRLIPTIQSIKSPVLWYGPDGVGKRTYAAQLISGIDQLGQWFLNNPTVNDVRKIYNWADNTMLKVAVIEMSDTSFQVQAAITKLFQKSSQNFKVILLSSHLNIHPSLLDMCFVYEFYPLSRKEIISILEVHKFTPDQISLVIDHADGSIRKALDATKFYDSRMQAQALLALGTAADQAVRMREHPTPNLADFIAESLVERNEITPTMLDILGREAGDEGRALLTLMVRKMRSKEED